MLNGVWARGVMAGRYIAFFLLAGLAGCASGPSTSALQPFSTDGCSLFPDRSLMGQADWCACCVAHDLAYWRGGTGSDRRQADAALKACARNAAGHDALADLMFAGVRLGGGPYFLTPYRWGYGWPYGRGYAPLTEEESARADELEKNFRAGKHEVCCLQPSPPSQ